MASAEVKTIHSAKYQSFWLSCARSSGFAGGAETAKRQLQDGTAVLCCSCKSDGYSAAGVGSCFVAVTATGVLGVCVWAS